MNYTEEVATYFLEEESIVDICKEIDKEKTVGVRKALLMVWIIENYDLERPENKSKREVFDKISEDLDIDRSNEGGW